MGQTFLVRHNCINIETYLYISETFFNCDKFVTDRDNNIYKSDNFYLYNVKNVDLKKSFSLIFFEN